MATNNDIVRADVPKYINDTLGLIYAEIQKGETNYIGMMQRLAVIIDDKSRIDTAKQIFEELEGILKRGSKVYDTVEHKVYCELTIEDENDYKALKKKYQVD